MRSLLHRASRGWFGGSSRRGGPDPVAACVFEALEERRLMSANVVGGVATIEGTNAGDKIVVVAGANDGEVIVKKAPGVAKNTVLAGVDAIVINGLDGDDRITVKGLFKDTGGNAIGVTIDAGDGNDRIKTDATDDDITCGAGDDRLKDKGGDNVIDGGAGRNRIFTGTGDDTITAGDDDNFIKCKAGNNTITTGLGVDRIFTGFGDDDISSGDGDDFIKCRGSSNTIDDGPGDDRVKTDSNGKKTTAGTVTFDMANAAQITGTSADHGDKQYFKFVAPISGTLSVTITADAGPLAEAELEDQATSADLLELEDGDAMGTAAVVAGRTYILRMRAAGDVASTYTVDLAIA